VKVICVEGLASHDSPESCASPLGNHGREALTGERVGWVLSRESTLLRGADAVRRGGRQHRVRRYRKTLLDPARSETLCMHGRTSCGNREILRLAEADGASVRIGKSEDVRR